MSVVETEKEEIYVLCCPKCKSRDIRVRIGADGIRDCVKCSKCGFEDYYRGANTMSSAKWTILDLSVIKYYLFLRNGKVTRLHRFGKTEGIERSLGKSFDWTDWYTQTPKAEGEKSLFGGKT